MKIHVRVSRHALAIILAGAIAAIGFSWFSPARAGVGGVTTAYACSHCSGTAPSWTTLTDSAGGYACNLQGVTFTAAVRNGTAYLTGSVSFYANNVLQATVALDANDNAQWSTGGRNQTKTITAQYSGDSNYLPSGSGNDSVTWGSAC